jgi:hypothetical protein
MLYSKNGSIPYPETDGSDGWIEVPDAPIAPEGKEVVWWYPPGWVVRDPAPAPASDYAWSQSTESWVKIIPQNQTSIIETLSSESVSSLTTNEVSSLSSLQISSLSTEQIGV